MKSTLFALKLLIAFLAAVNFGLWLNNVNAGSFIFISYLYFDSILNERFSK